MADYTTRTVHTTRHEWIVPTHGLWGACIAEVFKAVSGARQAYESMSGQATDFDDWLRVKPGDDEIILYFEIKREER